MRTKAKGSKRSYAFKAEAIEELRRQGQSWKLVAEALGLKGPGAARTAYTDLTGKSHNDIEGVATTRSAPKPKTDIAKADAGATKYKPAAEPPKAIDPMWDADSDQDEIIARLENCGSIVVLRTQRGSKEYQWHEEIGVGTLIGLRYEANDTVLAAEFYDAYNGGFRCVRVNDIKEIY